MSDKIIIREATTDEIENWDELISRFQFYRVTQTLDWLNSLRNYIDGKLLFLIFEKNGEIAACFPGMIVKIGFLRIFGSPLPGWQTISMGPVFDENRISTEEIISNLITFLEKKFGIYHIEIMSSLLESKAMKNAGFQERPEFTYKLPLFPGEKDKNFKLIKPSARRNIKRAIELGLTVETRNDENFVDEIYEQITEVFLRGGNTVPFTKKRVSEFFLNMKKKNRLISLAVNLQEPNTCIATALFTIENRELLLWSWTHRTKDRWYRPTELMTWTAMEKALEAGCESFDFMGRGNFKANFGAKLINDKTRWIRSRYAWLTFLRDVSEKLYRLQQSVQGKISKKKLFSFSKN